jgi:hypothetical protein
MPWDQFLERLIVVAIDAAPWLIGGLGGLSIISFGPLGRALSQRLRHGTEDTERSTAILEELTAVRRELEEVIERQYATERLLTGHRGEQLTPNYPTPTDAGEVTDPPR